MVEFRGYNRAHLPIETDWERDIHSPSGRESIRKIAESVVEIAKRIHGDIRRGQLVYFPGFWRGGIIPYEGILYALQRMGVDVHALPKERFVLKDMHISPEESTPEQTRAYIREHFQPPPGSKVYYVDEALGGNVSRTLSTLLHQVSHERGAEVEAHLLLSHDGQLYDSENRKLMGKLKDKPGIRVFFHPVPRVDWMDHAPILGWNWGRDLVFPKEFIRHLLESRASVLGLSERDTSGFRKVVSRHVRLLGKYFDEEYGRLKSTKTPFLLIRNADQYHNQYLSREQLVHSALARSFDRLFQREEEKGSANLFGYPLRQLYAVVSKLRPVEVTSLHGKPIYRNRMMVHVGGKPVEFPSLGGRLMDPHVYHIHSGRNIPELTRLDYTYLVHDPQVLIKLPYSQSQSGNQYRSYLKSAIRGTLKAQNLLVHSNPFERVAHLAAEVGRVLRTPVSELFTPKKPEPRAEQLLFDFMHEKTEDDHQKKNSR